MSSLATACEMAEAAKPTMAAQQLQQLRALARFAHNDGLLAALGVSKEVCLLSHSPSSVALACCLPFPIW